MGNWLPWQKSSITRRMNRGRRQTTSVVNCRHHGPTVVDFPRLRQSQLMMLGFEKMILEPLCSQTNQPDLGWLDHDAHIPLVQVAAIRCVSKSEEHLGTQAPV